jgi:phospholipid-binding lipoprotein MlaA
MKPGGRDPAPRTRRAAVAVISAALIAGISCAPIAGPRDPSDPWERMNRGTFRFNEGLDRWVVAPVATGMDFVIPDPVERAMRRAFDNARIPIHFGNALLQLKFKSAFDDLARFLLNSTIGFAGLFDVAIEAGLEAHHEDFGQTLGYWGVPAYPYLVLPIFGPSSPRDTVGLAVDTFSTVYPWFVPIYVPFAIGVGDRLNWRSLALDQIAAEREAALDYYVAVRNAYLSYRENQVRDQKEDETDDEDLYYFD